MCCCDDDQPIFYNQVSRKARKPHRCAECCREIRIGEVYEEHSGKWDFGLATFRICAHCTAAVEVIKAIDGEACFCFEFMWEDMADRGLDFHHYPSDRTIARVRAGARRKWTHRRGMNAGKLMPVPVMVPAVMATAI